MKVLSSVIFLAFRVAVAQGLSSPSRASDSILDTLIIPSEQFSLTELTRLSLEIIKNRPSNFRDIWFFTSRSEADEFQSAKMSVEVPYTVWRLSYERIHEPSLRVAEMVSIRDSAILLLRDRDRRVTRKVLAGVDPLSLEISGSVVHISHFSISPLQAGAREFRITAYAWCTGPLDRARALAVLEQLGKKLPFRDVLLHMRQDPWFISDVGFPVLPPFDPEFSAPPKEEYAASSMLVCDRGLGREGRCTLFSRQE
jgi:hypothetical protein